jgi:hypothetical protein
MTAATQIAPQTNPLKTAIAAVTTIGSVQLNRDAILLGGDLFANTTPLQRHVSIGLIALGRVTLHRKTNI